MKVQAIVIVTDANGHDGFANVELEFFSGLIPQQIADTAERAAQQAWVNVLPGGKR